MSIAADSYMSLNKTIKCNQLSHHCDFELLTIDIRSKNVISNQRGKGNKIFGNGQNNYHLFLWGAKIVLILWRNRNN